MELKEVLKGTSLSDFFTIDKVGLEYEPELALFFNSPIPIACKIRIRSNLSMDCNTTNFNFIDKGDYWKLVNVKLTPVFILIICRHKFQELANYYGYKSHEDTTIVDAYTNNFEIRTKIQSSIQDAVINANAEYKFLVKILLDLKIPNFALINSGLRIKIKQSDKHFKNPFLRFFSTKHLNFSGKVTRKYLDIFKVEDIYTYNIIRKWFNVMYPHYFKFCCGNTTGIDFKSVSRVHINLPYKFKDYDKLLQGTAVLPDIKEIFNYQVSSYIKGDKTSRGMDYKNCEAQVLGRVVNSKWVSCNNLV